MGFGIIDDYVHLMIQNLAVSLWKHLRNRLFYISSNRSVNHQHSPKHWQWKPFNEINVYQVECTIELHNCFVCIISKPIKKSTWETLKLLYPIALALYQHYTTMQKYYMPRLSPFLHLAVKQKHKNLLNSHYYNIFLFLFFSFVSLE